MHHKKVISINVTEKSPLFTFTHVRQIFLLKTFFGAFFYNFFDGFEASLKFYVFYIFFDFLCIILALFANFETDRAKNGSKNQKTYFVYVS
jgi:hypothetical protein